MDDKIENSFCYGIFLMLLLLLSCLPFLILIYLFQYIDKFLGLILLPFMFIGCIYLYGLSFEYAKKLTKKISELKNWNINKKKIFDGFMIILGFFLLLLIVCPQIYVLIFVMVKKFAG